MADQETIFAFYDFEFSTRTCELRRRGLRIRLSASQIRLITMFLSRPGELISREEVAARLWADPSSVDVPSGVNTAINRLRYSLGDNASDPSFLETVVGLGYRFIAPVNRTQLGSNVKARIMEIFAVSQNKVQTSQRSNSASGSDTATWPEVRRRITNTLILVVAVVLLLAAFRITHPRTQTLAPATTSTPASSVPKQH